MDFVLFCGAIMIPVLFCAMALLIGYSLSESPPQSMPDMVFGWTLLLICVSCAVLTLRKIYLIETRKHRKFGNQG